MGMYMDKNWKKFSREFLKCHKVCDSCGKSTNIYCNECKYLVMKDKELMRAHCEHPDCETPFMRNQWYNDKVEMSFGVPDFMNRHNDCKLFEAKEG